ncbi:hypothetical protein HYV64_04765 [Candidatus Shapirobacteria bacterium]|nr:hypothetical protein [Candidatus Shapirobacteria bacterium]
MDSINTSIKSHTGLIIIIAIAVSFVFPGFGSQLKPYLNSFLIAMMFLSCLDLKISEIVHSLSDFKNISLMLVIVHMVSPLIIFLLQGYFSPPVFLGLIISATIPAGRSAVFLSHIYGGVPIKALVSTSVSNFLSPITVPLFVWVFAHTVIKMDLFDMSRTIVYLVAIPLILAVLFGKTKYGHKLNEYSPSISIVILFFIILGIISPLKNVVVENLQLSLILGVVISVLIVVDFCLGYFLGKNHPEKVTYAISSSYKNYTLGTLLALTVFTPLVALPSVIYTVVSNLLLIPLQMFLAPKTKPKPHHHHKRHNVFLLVSGVFFAIVLAYSPLLNTLLEYFSPHPLITAFIAGVLFASTFTVATGGILLIKLSEHYSPLLLILSAGMGAAFCDYLIFSLVKDKAPTHVAPVYKNMFNHSHLHKILHTHYFAWTLPVIGAIVMASPLPDEIAVSLLGISKLTDTKFILIALTSHLIGMAIVVAGSRLL